jgi:hypothetical protein
VDLNPVNVADDTERLWLRALVWPENQRAADLLTAALDSVAGEPPAMISCPESLIDLYLVSLAGAESEGCSPRSDR